MSECDSQWLSTINAPTKIDFLSLQSHLEDPEYDEQFIDPFFLQEHIQHEFHYHYPHLASKENESKPRVTFKRISAPQPIKQKKQKLSMPNMSNSHIPDSEHTHDIKGRKSMTPTITATETNSPTQPTTTLQSKPKKLAPINK